MRSAEDIRQSQVTLLGNVLLRPGMYGTGQSLEMTIRAIMQLLAFIDEREDDFSQAFSALHRNGLWGPLGTAGALAGALGGHLYQTDEIAAVYARLASQLGYWRVEDRISDGKWMELEHLRTWPADWPRTPSAIEAQLGRPSFRCGHQWPRVFAYAGPGDDAWLFLVFSDSKSQELEHVILPHYPLDRSVIDLRLRAITASPEEVYRRFLIAAVQGDGATIRKLVIEHPEPTALFEKPYPTEVARALAEQYRSMDVVRVSPPGERLYLISDGCPVPLALVKDGAAWRVDADPLIRLWASRQSV
jgi:hypothetical protein